MKRFYTLSMALCAFVSVFAQNVVTFEGDYFNALIDNPQYGGALIYSGDEYKWTDAETSLSSMCDKADWSQWGMGFGWNNGCAISNYVDATATSYQGQLSVPASNGSSNFVIVWDDNSYLEFADGKARIIKSIDVINTSYALSNINKNCGDGYFFKAVATGYNGEEETGKVDIMLAEGENVVDAWTRVDLSALGAVTKVVFTFDGSDRSSYGVSTPKYFALDNVALENATAISIATAIDSTVTGIYSMDGKKMNAPVKGINIFRMSDGTTKKMIIK